MQEIAGTYGVDVCQTTNETSNTYAPIVKPGVAHLTNENAASAATEHGANSDEKSVDLLPGEYQARLTAASRLCHAIADCHPDDACQIMEAALGDLRAGMPIAPFDSIRVEADSWASVATPFEAKAYLWAIWQRMPDQARGRFLGYAQGEVVA